MPCGSTKTQSKPATRRTYALPKATPLTAVQALEKLGPAIFSGDAEILAMMHSIQSSIGSRQFAQNHAAPRTLSLTRDDIDITHGR